MRPEIELVSHSTPLTELVTRMMASSHSHFFVVGKTNQIQGHISLETLRPLLKDYETVCDVIIASDLEDKEVVTVQSDESLDMIMQLFGKFNLDEIPVINNDQIIGIVNRGDVIEAYNREIFKQDMASGLATSFRFHQKMSSERLALVGGFLILEIPAPESFVGKSLAELNLREHFGATVLTIKRGTKEAGGNVSYLVPTPSIRLTQGDVLALFGLQKDLSRFPRS